MPSLQKSFILWVSVDWRLRSQLHLRHHHSLCIGHIHHTGKHVSLFLSNHELQSLIIYRDSWSIFISILTNSFCIFSILGMPAKGVSICRLQHPHSPPMGHDRAFWSWATCSVSQNMRCDIFFKNYMFYVYINDHANAMPALFACQNCLASLACSSEIHMFVSENTLERASVLFFSLFLFFSFMI